jgi:hypothetical protein
VKVRLGVVKLSEELEDSLNHTNGTVELIMLNSVNKKLVDYLVWKTCDIIERNAQFRNSVDFIDLYEPFDDLVFLLGAGNGDLFAFKINNNITLGKEIFVYSHEDYSRSQVASNLTSFIKNWTSGTLSI